MERQPVRWSERVLRVEVTREKRVISPAGGEPREHRHTGEPMTALGLLKALDEPTAQESVTRTRLAELGRPLASWLFDDRAKAEIAKLSASGGRDKWARIELMVSDETLEEVPFEAAYIDGAGHLGVLDGVTVVRTPALSGAPATEEHLGAPTDRAPLGVFAVGVELTTRQYPHLKTASELAKIKQACERARLDCDLEQLGTWATVEERLNEDPPRVFHFAGHGSPGGDALVFREDASVACEIAAVQLAPILAKAELVVLNACHSDGGLTTAVKPELTSLGSIGQVIADHGVPSIVGVQCPLTDAEATVFSPCLYERLGAGDATDVALQRARRAMHDKHPEHLAWAFVVQRVSREPASILDAPAKVDEPDPDPPLVAILLAGLGIVAAIAGWVGGTATLPQDDNGAVTTVWAVIASAVGAVLAFVGLVYGGAHSEWGRRLVRRLVATVVRAFVVLAVGVGVGALGLWLTWGCVRSVGCEGGVQMAFASDGAHARDQCDAGRAWQPPWRGELECRAATGARRRPERSPDLERYCAAPPTPPPPPEPHPSPRPRLDVSPAIACPSLAAEVAAADSQAPRLSVLVILTASDSSPRALDQALAACANVLDRNRRISGGHVSYESYFQVVTGAQPDGLEDLLEQVDEVRAQQRDASWKYDSSVLADASQTLRARDIRPSLRFPEGLGGGSVQVSFVELGSAQGHTELSAVTQEALLRKAVARSGQPALARALVQGSDGFLTLPPNARSQLGWTTAAPLGAGGTQLADAQVAEVVTASGEHVLIEQAEPAHPGGPPRVVVWRGDRPELMEAAALVRRPDLNITAVPDRNGQILVRRREDVATLRQVRISPATCPQPPTGWTLNDVRRWAMSPAVCPGHPRVDVTGCSHGIGVGRIAYRCCRGSECVERESSLPRRPPP